MKLWLVCAIALAGASLARAEPPTSYAVRKFGVEQGLLNPSVWDIAQDGDGTMWFATEDGLYRYDGSRFTRFAARDGLPSDQPRVIRGNATGLWVGTTAGLARIAHGRIEAIGATRGLPEETIEDLALGPDGAVWVATELGVFHRVGERFERAPGWPGGPSHAIWVDRDGGIVAGRGRDVVIGDGHGRWRVLDATAGFGHDPIDAIVRDGDATLWVRSARFLKACSAAMVCRDETPALRDASTAGRLAVDPRGELWVPTHRGIAHHRRTGWEIVGPDRGVPTRAVWTLFEDRDGSTWICSDTLYQVLGRGLWEAYPSDDRFPADIVWAIARDARGGLWVGSNRGLLSGVGDTWRMVAGTEAHAINAMIQGPDHALYVAGLPAQLFRVDPATGVATPIGPPVEGERILTMVFDPTGTLWAGTRAGGLLRLAGEGADRAWVRVELPAGNARERIDQLIVDRAGRLWAAGHAGLAVRDGSWHRFTARDGLRATAVSYLVERRAGAICVGYFEAHGVTCVRYDGALTALEHRTTAEGLVSDKIYVLGEDDHARLYVGSGAGVDVLGGAFSSGPIEHFSSANGLVGDDLSARAFLGEPGGDVFLGTTRGLARFKAQAYTGPRPPPAPIVTRAWLGGDPGDPRAGRDPRRAALAAPEPGDTTFAVEFAAPSFSHGGQLEYEVRLTPLDQAWRRAQAADARYAPVPPGAYTFEVRARIAPGAPGAVTAIRFTVEPAWWQRLWIRILGAVGVLAIAGVAIGWRARVIAGRDARRIVARSEASFRTLIEQSPDAVFVRRGPALVYVNAAAIAVLGYDREDELVGRRVLDLVHPEERELVTARFQALASNGEATGVREQRMLRKDGAYVTLEVLAMPVHFAGMPSVIAIGRDCTARKQLEARLVLSDRMASLGTLSAGVGHEINNPLAYIKANLELIAEELARAAAPAEVRDAAADAMVGATQIQNIVAGLKTFSRQAADPQHAVELHEVLDLALRMTGNQLRHRCQIEKAYGNVPSVLGDESRLGQLFVNLLVNAAQAIAEGAADHHRVTLTTSTDARGFAVIEIRDTGCGMAPDVARRAFEPFFTTKEVGSGTGLGLSICHGIVTSLGGEISLASELGRGTTLRVALPPASVGPVSHPAPSTAEPAPRARILVVDDDDRLRQAIGRRLGKHHTVTLADRAADALAAIAGGTRFDVIVSDLMMPEMTGMQFYREVVQAAPDQARRMIFMTGGAFTDDARAFLETILNPWLEKPFELARLSELVRTLTETEAAA